MFIDFTWQYIDAFYSRDLDRCAHLFIGYFILKDPLVKRVEIKGDILKIVKKSLDFFSNLSFTSKNIYPDSQMDIISLTGINIMGWKNRRINELKVYFNISKDEI